MISDATSFNRMRGRYIHYYIHGRGRGHATRTLEIAEALERAGWRLQMFAGHDAFSLIQRCRPVERVDSLRPSDGVRLAPRLLRRVLQARSEVAKHRPALIISDGDLPSILAARTCGVPAIAVGHAEVFGETRRPLGTPRLPWLREKIGARISSVTASSHIAVGFVKTQALNDRTVVAAPAVESIRRVEMPSVDAVCYFRDDNGKGPVSALVEMGMTPLLFTDETDVPPGARAVPLDRQEFLTALAKTRLVVASAGSQLISECVVAGIPLFALYARRDDEQRLNVSLLRQTGIGDGSSFEGFLLEKLQSFVAGIAQRSMDAAVLLPDARVDEVVVAQVEALAATRRQDG